MAQFRKDPFGPAWVLISPERGLEASDFGSAASRSENCALCPGGDAGSELRALRPSTSATNAPDWRLRVVRHPSALLDDKPFELRGEGLFIDAPGSGYQEVIVEHSEHGMRLEEMSAEHLLELLKLYRERAQLLGAKPGVKHVQITRNVGKAAGAAYDHPHAQLLALPVPNRWVEEERQAAQEYFARERRCLFCDVIAAERAKRERLVSHNQAFVALAPYAAKTPFETWILPTVHASGFTETAVNTLPALGALLQAVLRAMNTALNVPPYNMIVHMLPLGDDESYHWHLELLPRLTRQAGFDWGSGLYINPTPPEDAARFLRETLSLQGVG
jgi:UDPglucose--hexose-1-phosphate uridylyltransferase